MSTYTEISRLIAARGRIRDKLTALGLATAQDKLDTLAGALDGPGRLMGLDGMVLVAFLLGFPANEIVLPVAVMIYTAQGGLAPLGGLASLRGVLAANGWTQATAACVMIFSLLHWPCSTTLLTIKKESGGMRWAVLAAALPTAFGAALCVLVNLLFG